MKYFLYKLYVIVNYNTRGCHCTLCVVVQLDGTRFHKKGSATMPTPFNMVRPERFERPTPWFVAKYSIQLSYGRLNR